MESYVIQGIIKMDSLTIVNVMCHLYLEWVEERYSQKLVGFSDFSHTTAIEAKQLRAKSKQPK